MTQRDQDQNQESVTNEDQDRRERPIPNTGDQSAGSQAATTGYGTGDSGAQGAARARQGQDTPSNAGDAGFHADEAVQLSDERTEQMAHADGSSEADDPDV